MTELPPLARFLRSRRERLAPEAVGLRGGGRRRTPGLRREEVAALAGVSVDYLVRLEQGRDSNPSAEVLGALARVLQLGDDEARHLFALAAVGGSPELRSLCPAAPDVGREVSALLLRILDQLGPIPAHLLDPLTQVVAANDAWASLVRPIGLEPGASWARHLFTDPEARHHLRGWAEHADAAVARIAAVHRRAPDDPEVVALVAELRGVDAFAERWEADPFDTAAPSTVRLRLPEAPDLRLTVEVLAAGDGHVELVTWHPADQAAQLALDRLLARSSPVSPAQLRVVGRA